eukprot:TRINITY_DN17149_c0_g1_i1.p1 TRINITY_DN17149_c0_g1~~TRINITY_DN17149_c0_g1_i1.p1  ORF type:complete len:516 (+),score=86.15 TRINITY_DN17149_c0_g1_i1:42-1589(+)
MSTNDPFAEGNMLRENGDFEASIKCYRNILEDTSASDETRAMALFFQAMAMQEGGESETEELIEAYSNSIHLKGLPHALNNRGLLYQKIGDTANAISDFENAILSDPTVVSAHFNLGNILDDCGNHEDAVTHYDTAIRLRPNYAAAFLNKGVCLDNLGDYSKAIDAYQKAAILLPLDPSPYHNKGISLNQTGSFTEALSAFSKALILKPDYYSALVNKAISFSNLGNTTEALSCLTTAKSIRPNTTSAYLYSALLGDNLSQKIKDLSEVITKTKAKAGKDPEYYSDDYYNALFYHSAMRGFIETESEPLREIHNCLTSIISQPDCDHILGLVARSAISLKRCNSTSSISPMVAKDLKLALKSLRDPTIVLHDIVLDREILISIITDLAYCLEPELCPTLDPSFAELDCTRRSFLTSKLLLYAQSFPRSLKTANLLQSEIVCIKCDITAAKKVIRSKEEELLLLLKNTDSEAVLSPEAFVQIRKAKSPADRDSIIQQMQHSKSHQKEFGCQNCTLM